MANPNRFLMYRQSLIHEIAVVHGDIADDGPVYVAPNVRISPGVPLGTYSIINGDTHIHRDVSIGRFRSTSDGGIWNWNSSRSCRSTTSRRASAS